MDRVMIDTDILSYFFRGDQEVKIKFKEYLEHFNFIEISIITHYEITSGLLAKNAFKQLEVFNDFMSGNIILPLTVNSSKISSDLYASLRKSGNSVDDIDLLIAGIAIENNLTLVTNNVNHFGRIGDLKIQNWKNK
jgi:tRNA(fMet)-specific endonuclease VapC